MVKKKKSGLVVVSKRDVFAPLFHEKREGNLENERILKRNLNEKKMIRKNIKLPVNLWFC